MKYRHVLCLYPYTRESSAALGFFPPAGLEYVATALAPYVGRITLVDLRQERDYRRVEDLARLIREGVDLLCVSVNWHYYFDEVCGLLNRLPRDVPLVVGGQYATEAVEELFERCPGIDLVVRGEGEETAAEIARGAEWKDIAGLSYRSNGRVVHNEARPLPPVRSLRHPDRSLRRTRYTFKSKGVTILDGGFDTVLTARGCPYNCKFCTFKLNPLGQVRHFSARSPESVVEELQGLEAELIYILDDNFFGDTARCERICELIVQEGIRKQFVAQVRIEIARHPEMLRKAERAGFKFMLMGIESPHDRYLEQLGKGFTSKQVRDAFQVLRDFNFYYHCYFIYGNLGETREEMLGIADFARDIGAHSISAMRLQVRRFSPLKEVIERTPGYHMTAKGYVYSDRYGVKDLKAISREIKRRFYTPRQMATIVRKLFRIRFFALWDLVKLTARLPLFLQRVFKRAREKRRRRERRMARSALGLPPDPPPRFRKKRAEERAQRRD